MCEIINSQRQEIIECDICTKSNKTMIGNCCGLKWCDSCAWKACGLCFICQREELNGLLYCKKCNKEVNLLQSNQCRGCEWFYCSDCYNIIYFDCGSSICRRKNFESYKYYMMQDSVLDGCHPREWMIEEIYDFCNTCNKKTYRDTTRLCYCCYNVYCSGCLSYEKEFTGDEYGHVCKNSACILQNTNNIVEKTLYDIIDKI